MSWKENLRGGISELTALRLFDYGSAGPDLARLDCNELALAPTNDEMETFVRALRGVFVHRYPDVSGLPLREALAARWRIEPDEILLGNGSVENLAMLMTAFGAGSHGAPAKVLYPDPSFPYYEVVARSHGVKPVPVPLDANFQLDEARLARSVDEDRPALAIFASPNNPTGNRFDPDVLERLARRLDAAFVVDEAYADFDGRTMLSQARGTPGLFVMRSLSKVGLAGLRLGALVGTRKAVAEIDKVRLPWNVSAVAIALGCAALACPDFIERRVRTVVELRHGLASALSTIPGLIVYPSDANFLLVRAPADASEIAHRLLQSGVLVKDVSRPGLLERCLRITVGTASENERCVKALRHHLEASRAIDSGRLGFELGRNPM
jgi:histidinol-phosphate aminotransferase